jgi:hypothetical protein
MKQIFITVVMGALLVLPGFGTSYAQAPMANEKTASRDVKGWMKSARFILGVYNVEDMIQIPGTRWIVGSGVNTQGPGMEDKVITKNYLHVFDA